MAGDMLAPDDALSVGPVAGESKAGDAVAFCGDQLVLRVKAKNHIVQPLVVDHVKYRPAAAGQQEGAVTLQHGRD